MTQIQQIPILLPLAVGSVAVFCTVLIHAVPLAGTLWLVRREKSLGNTGRSFWSDTRIVVLVILFAMVAHLIEIALWAVIFFLCGEFADMGTSYYHSAVNFTSLGYGDVLLSPRWRMLGPLEAGNGMLLFGVTTAMVFAVILGLAHERFADLKESLPCFSLRRWQRTKRPHPFLQQSGAATTLTLRLHGSQRYRWRVTLAINRTRVSLSSVA